MLVPELDAWESALNHGHEGLAALFLECELELCVEARSVQAGLPASARPRQPRHDIDLPAGDRPRRDHRHRPHAPGADDVGRPLRAAVEAAARRLLLARCGSLDLAATPLVDCSTPRGVGSGFLVPGSRRRCMVRLGSPDTALSSAPSQGGRRARALGHCRPAAASSRSGAPDDDTRARLAKLCPIGIRSPPCRPSSEQSLEVGTWNTEGSKEESF